MFQPAVQRRPRIEQSCSRCQIFVTTSSNSLASIATEKAIYCDVGVRSVLRQIRQQLQVQLSARSVILHLEPASIDITEIDQQLIAFYNQEIDAGVDSDGIVQHRSEILKILRFFLDLKERSAIGSRVDYTQDQDRNQYDMIKTPTFADLSKKRLRSLRGNRLLSKFVKYLRRVHVKPMMQIFGDKLYKCRSQSFEAIVSLILI